MVSFGESEHDACFAVSFQYEDSCGVFCDPTDCGGGGEDTLVLIWSEEFNYSGPPDPAVWSYDIGRGNGGWGNAVRDKALDSIRGVLCC